MTTSSSSNKPEQYHAIRLWGTWLGSADYYIRQEQRKAARANAPLDSLYERDGHWHCVSGMDRAHHFRQAYAAYLAEVTASAATETQP